MFDLTELLSKGLAGIFSDLFNQLISYFGTTLANIMSTSTEVLKMTMVQNGIRYAQTLALSILIIKGMADTINTYILHKNGDPDADPKGLLIGIGQSVAVICCVPFIVEQIFTFGTKVSLDVAGLNATKAGVDDWTYLSNVFSGKAGLIVILMAIIIAVCLLVVSIQASIRGANLALMSVIAPILAINLSSTNTALFSQWFKQVIIICVGQALQIFIIQGALGILAGSVVDSVSLLMVFGWLWVGLKTPKFLQQFAYSTGFTGAVGSGAKQVGSMYIMRKMMTK